MDRFGYRTDRLSRSAPPPSRFFGTFLIGIRKVRPRQGPARTIPRTVTNVSMYSPSQRCIQPPQRGGLFSMLSLRFSVSLVRLPPAGVFLVPARKTRKNRLGGGTDRESLSGRYQNRSVLPRLQAVLPQAPLPAPVVSWFDIDF